MLASTVGWASRHGDHDGRVEAVDQIGSRVVVAFSWADNEGRRHDWAHVLGFREGLIVDLRDAASPRRAVAWMRLRAVLG